jgi:cellulose biosynthesis protein BcsQ
MPVLARNLAVAALMDGMATAIIDADDQGTLVHWRERRPHDSPTVLALGSKSVKAALTELKGRGPPSPSLTYRRILRRSSTPRSRKRTSASW